MSHHTPHDAGLCITTSGHAVARNRWLNAVSIGIPIAGTLAAFGFTAQLGITGITIAVFLSFFLLNAFGITLGLHRYFTHHAFTTGPTVARVLAVLGSAACQGPIDRWVADHRRHHRFADQPWDTHSPYWHGAQKIESRWRGIWHAHFGWMIEAHVSDPKRYAPEISHLSVAGWASRY